MSSILQITEKRPWLAWALFFATIVVVFLLGLLASSIVERRAEAAFVNVPKKPLNQFAKARHCAQQERQMQALLLWRVPVAGHPKGNPA